MSFILLGILNSQVSAAAAGGYDLLETQVLSGTQNTVTFSNLVSTYGSDYQHLQIRQVARSNRAGDTSSRAGIVFNSDSNANYINHYYGTNGSTLFAGYLSQYTTKIINVDGVPAATAPADFFGGAIYTILDPFETTKYTSTRFMTGQAQTFNRISFNGGVWKNTNAIDSIAINDEYGDFVAGSRFSLYGLKGA